MNIQKTIAILLILAGVLGLIYGGFSYTKQTHEANIGSMHLNFDEKEYVSIPVWAGVVGITLGSALLVVGFRRR